MFKCFSKVNLLSIVTPRRSTEFLGFIYRVNHTLIQNFPICIGNWLKISSDNFYFRKHENILYQSKEESCLDVNLPGGFCALPCVLSQNRESHGKTASLSRYGLRNFLYLHSWFSDSKKWSTLPKEYLRHCEISTMEILFFS